MTLSQTLNGVVRRVPTWPVYLIGAALPVWYFYLGVTGGLGPEPVKALEHALGLLALQTLVAVLAVTPLRKLTGVSLVKFRRALGLLVFYFVAAHFAVWFLLDVQFISAVIKDLTKRPYIMVGMAALLLLIPLAATSSNWAIRKMGPVAWRRLHRLTYAIAVLGAVHFVMASKTWATEPLVYLALVLGLLAVRVPWQKLVGDRLALRSRNA